MLRSNKPPYFPSLTAAFLARAKVLNLNKKPVTVCSSCIEKALGSELFTQFEICTHML